jgi:hypothetical protein
VIRACYIVGIPRPVVIAVVVYSQQKIVLVADIRWVNNPDDSFKPVASQLERNRVYNFVTGTVDAVDAP